MRMQPRSGIRGSFGGVALVVGAAAVVCTVALGLALTISLLAR
jgi:hypothetical protein